MSDIVFYIAMVWLIGLFCVCIVMVARAESGLVRILSLDVLSLVLVAVLIVYSSTEKNSYYLDAALVLALISFVSILAAARYHAERRLF